MAHFLSLKPVDDILELIAGLNALDAERIPLESALGRVLAEPFPAPEDLPGFDRSTMDGYAVRARDVFGASEGMPALLELLGECPMGAAPDLSIGAGQTARIWTGGMLPAGADAVVMLEYAREAGSGQVELTRPVAPLENVITRDEDAARGELLLPAGRILRPQELGLLAAFGTESVLVRRKPRLAVISSGDEVVPLSARPGPGQVRDINSHTLAGLVRAAGGECRTLGIAPDSAEALRGLVMEALDRADAVLLSGGSSAGQRDFTVQAFEAVGAEILAHGVAISPGKPLILARKGQKTLWGLPGHAASALVCAEVFIRPLLRRLSGEVFGEASGEALGLASGQASEEWSGPTAGPTDGPAAFSRRSAPEEWRRPRQAVLTRSVHSAQGRRDYIRVRLSANPQTGELPLATPLLGKSGLITTLVEADALVVCPEDQEGLAAGQPVDLHELL